MAEKMDTRTAKELIFKALCSCKISLYMACYAPDKAVVPISNFCSLIKGLTKYRARLALKELVSEGLVEYTHQGCPAIVSPSTENGYGELIDDAHPPINGYALTKKGFESDIYKSHKADWEKSMEDWAKGEQE